MSQSSGGGYDQTVLVSCAVERKEFTNFRTPELEEFRMSDPAAERRQDVATAEGRG